MNHLADLDGNSKRRNSLFDIIIKPFVGFYTHKRICKSFWIESKRWTRRNTRSDIYEIGLRQFLDHLSVSPLPLLQTMGLNPQAFFPTHGSMMLHSLVYIKICINHIKQSNFIRAKFTQRTPKNWTNHLTPFKCHFRRLIKMVVPMAKIKQVFKVEKLNPQQEDTIKSLLHLSN